MTRTCMGEIDVEVISLPRVLIFVGQRSGLLGAFGDMSHAEVKGVEHRCAFLSIHIVYTLNSRYLSSKSFWLDSRMGTLYAAVLSFATLIVHLGLSQRREPHSIRATPSVDRGDGIFGRIHAHLVQYGSLTIAVFKISRLLSAAALLVLTTAVTFAARSNRSQFLQLLAEVAALVSRVYCWVNESFTNVI